MCGTSPVCVVVHMPCWLCRCCLQVLPGTAARYCCCIESHAAVLPCFRRCRRPPAAPAAPPSATELQAAKLREALSAKPLPEKTYISERVAKMQVRAAVCAAGHSGSIPHIWLCLPIEWERT